MGEDGFEIPTCGKGARFLCASYSDRLSLRDSLRCRNIVSSPFYAGQYQIRVSADQKAKSRFDIRGGGYRVATSTGGLATGEGGDIILVDDPHNVKQADSEIVREETIRWFAEVLPTRFNDPSRGAQVVIMQRVHERDVSGYIISQDLGYTHLCLPAKFEHSHPHCYPKDPRKLENELLWPNHIGPAEIETLEKTLGSYAAAGQLQQRPSPRDGGLFQRHWIRTTDHLPNIRQRVRAWDVAGSVTGYDPDWTVGVLMSRDAEGFMYIEDIVRFRATSGELERQMRATALLDGKAVQIIIPKDPGAAGKHQTAYIGRQLAGYNVSAEPQTGDKQTRAAPFASQCEMGNVRMLRAAWNEGFLNELCNFPNGRHDDQVDAAATAFNALLQHTPTVSSIPMKW